MKLIKNLYEIINLLNDFNVIAMPTDTVYGLMLKATKENESILKTVKCRPENKPLPLVVNSIETLLNTIDVDEKYLPLLNQHLPGALTVVGKAKIDLNHETLAVRVPDNALMLEVTKNVGACWLTSANLSGETPCLTVDQVNEALQSRIDYVVEGNCRLQVPSTIISVVDSLKVLRQGSILIEQ